VVARPYVRSRLDLDLGRVLGLLLGLVLGFHALVGGFEQLLDLGLDLGLLLGARSWLERLGLGLPGGGLGVALAEQRQLELLALTIGLDDLGRLLDLQGRARVDVDEAAVGLQLDLGPVVCVSIDLGDLAPGSARH
jgi:hypothetical protein